MTRKESFGDAAFRRDKEQKKSKKRRKSKSGNPIMRFGTKVRKGLEYLCALTAINAGAIYGASELIDHNDFLDPTNALIKAGVGTALLGADYLALTSKKIKGLAGKINDVLDKKWFISLGKSALIAYSALTSADSFKPHYHDIRDELGRFTPRIEAPAPTSTNGDTRSLYDMLGHEHLVEHDFTGTKLAPKGGTRQNRSLDKIGRIQRTLRWEPLYNAIEEDAGMPKNLLGAMIMQESYGDPVQPNASNDGGLGLVHIQGPTAEQWGLEIFGSSDRSSDRRHGGEIKKMLEDCDYDPACVEEFDERAHIIKVLDTAARIVAHGRQVHGSWDKGVGYYRLPGRPNGTTARGYRTKVEKWRNALNNRSAIASAAEDFQERNGYAFQVYLDGFHGMSNNWGLETYIAKKN